MNTMKGVGGILTLVLIHVCVGGAAQATTLEVPRDYATIQDAVDAANPGDTIDVDEGEYAGAVILKSVRIVGAGHDKTIINTPGSLFGDGFVIDASDVEIMHLAIDGEDIHWNFFICDSSDPDFDCGPGISNVVLTHLKIIVRLFGIQGYANNLTLQHTTIRPAEVLPPFYGGFTMALNSDPTRSWGPGIDGIVDGPTIEHNRIEGTWHGLEAPGMGAMVGHNDISVHGNGIVAFGDGAHIAHNEVTVLSTVGHHHGVIIWGSDSAVRHNNIANVPGAEINPLNGGIGVFAVLKDMESSVIEHNRVVWSTPGHDDHPGPIATLGFNFVLRDNVIQKNDLTGSEAGSGYFSCDNIGLGLPGQDFRSDNFIEDNECGP